ncbi:MAG TPA: M20/M25/M40 family metallo-hydrolase [Anaerolineales bacterium]|nr:M20/M25/M40 family metallo-hydrolase [Anaerolineales bacterium]
MVPASSQHFTVKRLLELATQIQQIPAPTFEEGRRAEMVRTLFAGEGLQDVSLDSVNNVYGRLPGQRGVDPLIISAHLDTVFPAEQLALSRQDHRIHGPGIGDNSLGVAALLGLLWMLRDAHAELDADVWFVANSCEEGLGDLRGMKEIVGRFGAGARGYLVVEGTALGQVYHRAVGVQRYRVSITTTGGHSWSDYGNPSAVHEVAGLVSQLAATPLPAEPRTTLNVGTISGGSGVNVLANHAQFDLDIRSEGPAELEQLINKVEASVSALSREGVTVDFEVIGRRPAGQLPPDHPWVQLALECIAAQGLVGRATSGSTDANIPLSLGMPAIVLGITTGAGAHTPNEYIDTPPVGQGMQQLYCFVSRLLAAS